MEAHVRARPYGSPAALALLLMATPVSAQFPPDSFTNLQVLPEDITAGELVPMMAGFTRALGVRCTHCHVGEEGQPLASYDFAADDTPAKEKARVMLRMVRHINQDHLAELDERLDPPLRVECATCHRGTTEPRMIQDVLLQAYDDGGVDSTLTTYRNLRNRYYGRFTYDFGEVPLADVAGQIEARGSLADAERVHAVNVEHNPESLFARGQHALVALRLAFRDGGIDAVVARYRELAEPYTAPVPERTLNQLGYALLRADRVQEAIVVFRLNVEAFPESWNVYDSLGEAYARAGETALAIENYERSLELNLDNDNARRMLAELRARDGAGRQSW